MTKKSSRVSFDLPNWFFPFAEVLFVAGVSLILALVFSSIYFAIDWLFFGFDFFYNNSTMFGCYMVFQIILTTLLLNGNIRVDWSDYK